MRTFAAALAFGFATFASLAFAQASRHPYALKSAEGFPGSVASLHYFEAKTTKGLLPDFGARKAAPATDCRARIREVICLVDPSDSEKRRPCLGGGEAYAPVFEALYDQYPPVLQRVFCSLDALYIEKQFFGTAYAGTLPGKSTIMGIRKSVLDEGLMLEQWSSWKEQLSFGGATENYRVDPTLPTTSTSTSARLNDFLYFVIAHEFGHILDFANKVNDVVESCREPEDENDFPECAMKPGTWGSISWATNKKPKAENDFANREGLCFYRCEKGTLDRSVVGQVYEDLFTKTNFLSTYTTQQPWDDFADSLAYFFLDRKLGSSYVVETNRGATYDVIERLRSEAFTPKYEYLERFVERTDIVYP